MRKPKTSGLLLRRAAAELALLLAVGLFLALLGPFGTAERSFVVRGSYWPIVIVGGGVRRRRRRHGGRPAAGGFLASPGSGQPADDAGRDAAGLGDVARDAGRRAGQAGGNPPAAVPGVRHQLAVMALRQLTWRSVWTERDRRQSKRRAAAGHLSPTSLRQRRQARLLAVEAEDHYLRVHTAAGGTGHPALQRRHRRAAGVPGFRAHRSWWVAADAIEAIRWRRGRARTSADRRPDRAGQPNYAPTLKAAGWF